MSDRRLRRGQSLGAVRGHRLSFPPLCSRMKQSLTSLSRCLLHFLMSSGRIWAKHGLSLCNGAGWALICPSCYLLATQLKHTLHLGTPAGCQTTFPMLTQQRASLLSSKEASPSALPQFSSYLAGGRRCAGDPARLARPLTSGKWF